MNIQNYTNLKLLDMLHNIFVSDTSVRFLKHMRLYNQADIDEKIMHIYTYIKCGV